MERTHATNRGLWIAVGLLAVLALLAIPAWTHPLGMGMGIGGGPYGARPWLVGPWAFGIFGFGLLIRFFVFGLILFFIVRLFRGRRGYAEHDPADPLHLSAGEILRRRYAAGELTREQYEEMRRTLEPTTT